MAYTLEQLQTLEDAIAQGVNQVMYGNKMVIYRSVDDMIKVRNMMRVELGLTPPTIRLKANHTKGL
jgi:hypothetical protein